VFERFDNAARATVVYAEREASGLRHDHIGTEHLLLGLLHDDVNPAALDGRGVRYAPVRDAVVTAFTEAGVPGDTPTPGEALATLGIDVDEVRRKAETAFGPDALRFPRPAFTLRAKKVLETSARTAQQFGQFTIGADHLLLGLIGDPAGLAAKTLRRLGVDLDDLRTDVVGRIAPEQLDLERLNHRVVRLSSHVSRLTGEEHEWGEPIVQQLHARVLAARVSAADRTRAVQRDLVAELTDILRATENALEAAAVPRP
jgi:ATP-dependent Clp protease ATP-binding subunit ClpA